jgi:hypothetical protein
MRRAPSAPKALSDDTVLRLMECEVKIEVCTGESRRMRAEVQRIFHPGHLYVAEFDSGVVKVGRAANAVSRLEAHAKTGLVRAAWTSPCHLYCNETERQLIAFCGEHGTLHGGREYFRDIAFDLARDHAERIVFGSRCRTYLDALIDAMDGDMTATVEQGQAALDAQAVIDTREAEAALEALCEAAWAKAQAALDEAA